MLSRIVIMLVLIIAVSGCSNTSPVPEPNAGHPASPDAVEAPPIPPSRTLASSDAPAVPEANTSMPGVQMHGAHDMGHGNMQHGDAAAPLPTTQPGAAAAISARRISPPTQAATTQTARYTCPMHAEVISDKPGKCPRCGMNLVEKKEAR